MYTFQSVPYSSSAVGSFSSQLYESEYWELVGRGGSLKQQNAFCNDQIRDEPVLKADSPYLLQILKAPSRAMAAFP